MAIKPIQILINAKDNASGVFSSLQAKIAGVGAAIAGYFGVKAFAGIVEGAADFEQAMSRVQAATGGSADEMAKLRKAAEDAGANTKYTSTEAAAALENLAKAGLSAGDAVATLPAVLNLAQAGDIGLADASEIVTKAIMGMGGAFTDAARYADVLALGANATNSSVAGLGQALSYVAPVAQSAGISLEGTVAILGKLSDAGIDASRSGTSLANILAQFSDPASQFKRALADAGITTNNFEDALNQLAAAGPKGEKAILAVGLNGGPALRALLNQGMPALDELKKKLENSSGSAATFAKVMQDNLGGSFKGLTSAWDALTIKLGTPVLPILKDGIDQLAGAFRGLIADGTIGKFGDAIATAFQAGIKWVREFLGTVDFGALVQRMQAFADSAKQRFDEFGQYATNAGATVKVAVGVVQTAFSTLMVTAGGVANAMVLMVQAGLKGLELLYRASEKVTFGKMSAQYKAMADDFKLQSDAMGAASDAVAAQIRAALGGIGEGMTNVQDGFGGIKAAIVGAKEETGRAAVVFDDMGKRLEDIRLKTVATQKATTDKAAADAAARVAIAALRDEYAALIAKGDLQAAALKITEINKALAGTAPAAKDAAKAAADAALAVERAFQVLGVTSTESLKNSAAEAKAAYETIKNAGTSSAQDIGAAFKVAAEKAIAANNGIAPSWVEAQAAARGYKVEVDAAGKAALKAGDDAATGTARAAEGWQGAASATREATQAVAEYQARMDKKYGRPGQGDKPEKLGEGVTKTGGTYRNKDGMSSNADGSVQSQWVWTRAAIIDYLQSAGLEDNLAEELAKQFVKSDGSVDYTASSAQKKWGGKYSTLAEALGKMVDYYKYNDQGKAEAANRTAYLDGTGKPPTQPPEPPGAKPERNTSFGNTYVSNITLPGGGTTTINFADAASQRNGEELMRQLAQGRGTYQ